MSIADVKYKEIIKEILHFGEWDTDGEVRPVYENGDPAHSKSIFGAQVKFQPNEVPIVTSKKTPVKSSINEIVHWFFRMKSNDVKIAEELGIGYWDQWKMEDDTLGRSYAYQLKNQKEKIDFGDGYAMLLDQVDSILYKLNNDPYSRRIMFSYWNPSDANRKALQECAWAGEFNIRNGRLDFLLIQRSVDVLLGLPSNWAGYYALQCALANIFNLKVGTFTHQMGNVHLYSNQIELAKELLNAKEYMQPEVWVNPEIDNFYDYGLEDIVVKNYKHGKSVRSDVAI